MGGEVDRSPDGRGGGATLLLVRHGESVANVEQRFTLDEHEPLTELGVEQARDAGRRLADHYHPVALYTSPFFRALETARQIGSFFDLAPEIVDEIHEQTFGELHGRPYLEFYPRMRDSGVREKWSLRPPGGESLEDVTKRVGPAIDRIAERHQQEQVLVVCHGGVLAALRAYVAGHFDQAPVSTENAGGFVLVGGPPLGGYRGPLALFPE